MSLTKQTRFTNIVGRTKAPSLLSLILVLGFQAQSQTLLNNGQTIPVVIEPSTANQLLNAGRGYRIPVPADAVRVSIRYESFTPGVAVELHARSGSDVVAAANNAVTADVSSVGVTADKRIAVQVFNGDSVYVALRAPASAARAIGRITATIHTMPADGVSVTIPSISQLMLAGAVDGTRYGYDGDSSPLSSPVSIPVASGQALQIVARGRVEDIVFTGNLLRFRGPWSPDGRAQVSDFAAYMDGINGLGRFQGRIGALIGIFTGDSLVPRLSPYAYSFTNDAGLSVPVLRPNLQQPFHVGSGLTPDDLLRTIVAPAGATKLYLGVAGFVNSSSGAFRAVIRNVAAPTQNRIGSPVRVASRSQLMLAGAADGSAYGYLPDVAPLHSPPSLPVTAGQTLRIRASGSVDLIAEGYSGGRRGPFPPDGRLQDNGNGMNFDSSRGISGYRGYLGGLVGLFTADSLNANTTPPTLDFLGNGLRQLQTVRPLLQQVFFIGTGMTSGGEEKSFTVPSGATRLYLGISGITAESNGEFYVTVSPDVSAAPRIAGSGFANGAGFGGGPFTAGSILSIFGSNFGAQQAAASIPLPTSLSDTQVWFNDTPASLYFVSPNQINVQVPPELSTAASAQVTVVRGGVAGPAAIVDLAPFRPGIFTAGGATPVLLNAVTGALINDASPAAPGDFLLFYASGAGPVAPPVASGASSPSAPLARGLFPSEVVLQAAGRELSVEPSFVGLAPGFVGVFQVNLQLPADMPEGEASMRLQSAPAGASNAVRFPVRRR